jgi:hypothetical protein
MRHLGDGSRLLEAGAARGPYQAWAEHFDSGEPIERKTWPFDLFS